MFFGGLAKGGHLLCKGLLYLTLLGYTVLKGGNFNIFGVIRGGSVEYKVPYFVWTPNVSPRSGSGHTGPTGLSGCCINCRTQLS